MTQQAQKAESAKRSENGHFWKGALIGAGIGGGIGGAIGYFYAKKKLMKGLKRDIKRAYDHGFAKGEDKAVKECQEWLDEHAIPVESPIEEAEKEPKVVVEKTENPEKTLNEAFDAAIFEKTKDMDDWDLSIDGEDARKRSIERERYLDLVEKYQSHPEDGPMHISRKEFEEECYLEKDWVTYYAGDNVFASDKDADSTLDGYSNFGVTDGNELFTGSLIWVDDNGNRIEDEDNDDENITYIRNFSKNSVYEITRTSDSYHRMRTGEAFLENGQAGKAAGDGGGC